MSRNHDGEYHSEPALETDRAALALAPLWALALTRGGHEVDAREVRALARMMQGSFLYQREFVRAALAPLTGQPESLLERFRTDGRSPEQGVRAAAEALSRASADDAMAYRTVLLAAVWRVTAASGGPRQAASLGALARELHGDA